MKSAAILPFPLAAARATIAAEAAGVTLEQLQRAELAVAAALAPPRRSTLIAQLAAATGAEREAILRQLEARK